MVRKKINYRNPLEVEKELFKVSRQILEGKLTPTQGQVVIAACNAWLRAHEGRKVLEMEQRVRYLEAARDLEAAQKKARQRKKPEEAG